MKAMEQAGRSALLLIVLAVLASGACESAVAAGEFDQFGFDHVSAQQSTSAAGAHPDFVTHIIFNHEEDAEGRARATARAEDVTIELPPGFVGNPNVVERCGTGEFVSLATCPIDAQVGVVEVQLDGKKPSEVLTEPLYSLQLPHAGEAIARFGFFAGFYPIFIDISVRTAGDYGLTAIVRDATGQAPVISAKTTFWGVPASPTHDTQRLTAAEAFTCSTACQAPGGKRSSGLPERPFLTNPSACQEQKAFFKATSYQLPGQEVTAEAAMAPIVGCAQLFFDATLSLEPTSRQAGAPTGLHAVLNLPQNEDPAETATSTMRTARVTLPEGLTINASAADGLGACSAEQVGLGTENAARCPDASKLGTARITSPPLPEPLQGTIYQRTPTPGHQFGLWLVVDQLGLHIKLPGEVRGDPVTGQLTTEFRDLPQLPVETIELDFKDGPRAPLKNPDACGTYSASAELAPWSGNPPLVRQSQMTIDQGCGVGFSPKLNAGVTNPIAGAFSPLIVDLTRVDGEDNLAGIELNLPPGELAKLKGVPLCPEELAPTGACPAASSIGSVAVAAGAGAHPLWIPQPGRAPTGVYLAGPYKSAPFSVVAKVPAQAGPFDLGTVAVRSALDLDPDTARAIVRTDPLPQVLEGAAISYRMIHVVIDRPKFMLNPTDCREMAVESTVTSLRGQVAHPATRFEVDGCRALKFKPGLSLKLEGGTKRGEYPALTATLKARPGDANIGRASVALPRSEFLAQEHIVTICTRVQFAANKCPRGSVYGKAKAWTPLLDRPLEGPVYLRSSSHRLPDLVAALGGQVDINLVGRIDSKNGGIRTTFESVPDAPVTKFVLKMKGGAKGLLVNSQNICIGMHRAIVRMRAQNGRVRGMRSLLRPGSCGQDRR